MTTTGKLRGAPRQVMPLPKRNRLAVYLVTSAQNNTDLHPELWANIQALAAHDGAEILVAKLTYDTNGQSSKGQKRSVK